MTDYIPREAVLEFVEPDARPFLAERIKSIPAADVVERASGIIGVIPAADVRPVVRGKWIDYQQGRWVYAKCSECETVHDVKSNYCPSCGADMREEQDGR